MLFQNWAKEKDNAVAARLMNLLIKLCSRFVISADIKMVLLPLILPAMG